MKEIPLSAAETLAMLRQNAARVVALTCAVPIAALETAPGSAAWSANEVMAHLRACSDIWGGNIGKILSADHPTFAGTNPRTWLKRTNYLTWRFEDAHRAFIAQREELLTTLEGLGPLDWERAATVMAYGQANERTLRSYASQLAKHEREHVRQIQQIVGPGLPVRRRADRGTKS